jgi:hypothetical protein
VSIPLDAYFEGMRKRYDPLHREKKLWAVVMEEAVDCMHGRVAGEHRSRRRELEMTMAREWFQSDRKNIGSFLWICHLLELEAEIIREKVLGIEASLNGGIL